jgi:hypothetical protein
MQNCTQSSELSLMLFDNEASSTDGRRPVISGQTPSRERYDRGAETPRWQCHSSGGRSGPMQSALVNGAGTRVRGAIRGNMGTELMAFFAQGKAWGDAVR